MIRTVITNSILALSMAVASVAPEMARAIDAAAAPTVRLAYFPNLTHATALVGVARGSFAEAVAPGRLDVKTFSNGPALIEALFAGEVDLGYVGPNPAINGYVKSKGDALRIVAGASSGGALFVVRPDAGIDGPKDLAGKKFAIPQLGGTQDVALRYYAKQHGLQTADKGGTVQIIPTQPADILTLFKEKQIDGAWLAEPWATRLVLEGQGKVLIDERTQWPNGKFVTTVVVARRAFLEAHPDVVERFLTAHVQTTDYIQAHGQDARRIVNQEIERITSKAIPEPVLAQAFANTDITYEPLLETLTRQADYAFDLGFLGSSKPELSGIYALDPLQKVVAQRRPLKSAAR